MTRGSGICSLPLFSFRNPLPDAAAEDMLVKAISHIVPRFSRLACFPICSRCRLPPEFPALREAAATHRYRCEPRGIGDQAIFSPSSDSGIVETMGSELHRISEDHNDLRFGSHSSSIIVGARSMPCAIESSSFLRQQPTVQQVGVRATARSDSDDDCRWSCRGG